MSPVGEHQKPLNWLLYWSWFYALTWKHAISLAVSTLTCIWWAPIPCKARGTSCRPSSSDMNRPIPRDCRPAVPEGPRPGRPGRPGRLEILLSRFTAIQSNWAWFAMRNCFNVVLCLSNSIQVSLSCWIRFRMAWFSWFGRLSAYLLQLTMLPMRTNGRKLTSDIISIWSLDCIGRLFIQLDSLAIHTQMLYRFPSHKRNPSSGNWTLFPTLPEWSETALLFEHPEQG